MDRRRTRARFRPARTDQPAPAVPDAAIHGHPGARRVHVGTDRALGWTLSLTRLNTLQFARFPRDHFGATLERLRAPSWVGESPEIL